MGLGTDLPGERAWRGFWRADTGHAPVTRFAEMGATSRAWWASAEREVTAAHALVSRETLERWAALLREGGHASCRGEAHRALAEELRRTIEDVGREAKEEAMREDGSQEVEIETYRELEHAPNEHLEPEHVAFRDPATGALFAVPRADVVKALAARPLRACV